MQKGSGTAALSTGLLIGLGWLVFGFATTHVGAVLPGWLHAKTLVVFVLVTAAISAALLLAFRRSAAVLVVAVGVFAFVIFGLAAVLTTIAVIWSAYLIGEFIHPRVALASDQPDRLFFRIAMGLIVLTLILNVVIGLPVNDLRVYGAVFIGLAGLRWRGSVKLALDLQNTWRLYRAPLPLSLAVVAIVVSVFVCVQLAYAAFPERQYDALAYHLVVAETVKETGRWHFAADFLVGAVQPLGADLLNSVAYVSAGEAGAKMMNYAFLLVSAGLLHSITLQYGRIAAAATTMVLLSCPIAFLEADGVYVENFLLLCTTFALAVSALWPKLPARDRVLSAAVGLAGLPTAKLHGVIIALVMFVVFIARRIWRDIGTAGFRVGFAACVLVALGAVPFLIAFVVTGNPMFPFFNGIFHSPYFGQSNFAAPYAPDLKLTALHDMTFHTSQHFQGADGTFGFQLVVFALPALIATAMRPRFFTISAIAMFLAYSAVVLSQTADARYFFPIMPALSVLIASAIGFLREMDNRIASRTAAASAGAVALLNFAYHPYSGWMLPQFEPAALVDASARKKLILGAVPHRLLIDRVNADNGPDARLVLFGQPVGYPLQGEPIFVNWYMPKVLAAVQGLQTDKDVAQWLASVGATHLMMPTRNESVPNETVIRRYLQDQAEPLLIEGTQALYRVPDDVVFSTMLAGPGEWQKWTGASAPPTADGIRIMQGENIGYATPPFTAEQRRLRIVVKAKCDDDHDQVGVQINWEIKGQTGRPLVQTHGLPCANGPADEITTIFDKPPNATGAVVYLTKPGEGGAIIEQASVSTTAVSLPDPVPLYERNLLASPAWTFVRRLLHLSPPKAPASFGGEDAATTERATSTFAPMEGDAVAMGQLDVLLPFGGVGNGRTFKFGRGDVVEAEFVGSADIAKPIGSMSLAHAFDVSEEALRNEGDPKTYLLSIKSSQMSAHNTPICDGASPSMIVDRDLNEPGKRMITLLILTAAPGDPAARICKRMRYRLK